MSMGLRELDPANWIEGGADLVEQLTDRSKILIENRDQVVQIQPGHNVAIDYFVSKIVENLAKFHPQYEVSDSKITHLESKITVDLAEDNPLVQLSRIIAEDLCLLQFENGAWQLVAAGADLDHSGLWFFSYANHSKFYQFLAHGLASLALRHDSSASKCLCSLASNQ